MCNVGVHVYVGVGVCIYDTNVERKTYHANLMKTS